MYGAWFIENTRKKAGKTYKVLFHYLIAQGIKKYQQLDIVICKSIISNSGLLAPINDPNISKEIRGLTYS